MTTDDQTLKIRTLNDHFRQMLGNGHVVFTRGIADLEPALRGIILMKVMQFDDFTEDNDPYGEHDFGAFDQPGVGKIFWKIDYYAAGFPEIEQGSEDPADADATARVLTIMRANEY